ncbi:hypothetical protein BGW36DRAFT_354252 [Talaromyces proteolyticus]|uniref:Aminoglycoside phosphotransferase domain-containing protein n=1 Tax=Talaromyces proteolyticus TaxID=1131652 RepID=A0AAD4L3E1_9EURO|nr:uncharacterized protein BGW36DRAFT_354252 [Talaromyces proteolyticus]KAH8705861.1 hypothetical protein BGW36DRAFT_354252 [Talaromyces proteolyticus]
MAEAIDDANSQDGNDLSRIFGKVRAIIKLENLPPLAARVRSRMTGKPVEDYLTNCHTNPNPIYGSSNILFEIEFSDKVCWLLKVPSNGYPGGFSEHSAKELRAEVLTMRLIKRETTVPIPEVFEFNNSCDNEVCCPFILMEYIKGKALQHVWFDQTVDVEILEKRRRRALSDVAKAMIQLDKFTFSQGGMILFDEDDKVDGVGPIRTVDLQSTMNRQQEDGDSDGGSSDNSDIVYDVGPMVDMKSWFTSELEKRQRPSDASGQGLYNFMDFCIDLAVSECQSALNEEERNAPQFVLAHPDFDIQNMIVSETDGSLQALIDWDGPISVPRYMLGNESYPGWLTRDWDELMYGYEENSTPGPDNPNNWENSPSELAHYRRVYQDIIEDLTKSQSIRRRTARTLALHNLSIAADNFMNTRPIMSKIFDEIAKITAKAEQSSKPYETASEDDASTDVVLNEKEEGKEILKEIYKETQKEIYKETHNYTGKEISKELCKKIYKEIHYSPKKSEEKQGEENYEVEEDQEVKKNPEDKGIDDSFIEYVVFTNWAEGKLSDNHKERLVRGFKALLSGIEGMD